MAFSRLFVTAVAAFSLVTSVSAVPVWDTSKFEAYDTYHARYKALDCRSKHDTTFFTTCCGPLAAGQALSSRPAECDPSSSGLTDDGSVECDNGATTTDSAYPSPADISTSTLTLNTVNAALTPTTTVPAPAPTSTSSHEKHESTSTSTAPTSASPASGATHTGQATFYYQGGQAGACGDVHSDSDLIGAINFQLYGPADQVSPTCGKMIKITNTANQNTVTIKVADDCPSCPGIGDIDLSTGAFDKLGSESTGVLPIEWEYM